LELTTNFSKSSKQTRWFWYSERKS